MTSIGSAFAASRFSPAKLFRNSFPMALPRGNAALLGRDHYSHSASEALRDAGFSKKTKFIEGTQFWPNKLWRSRYYHMTRDDLVLSNL